MGREVQAAASQRGLEESPSPSAPTHKLHMIIKQHLDKCRWRQWLKDFDLCDQCWVALSDCGPKASTKSTNLIWVCNSWWVVMNYPLYHVKTVLIFECHSLNSREWFVLIATFSSWPVFSDWQVRTSHSTRTTGGKNNCQNVFSLLQLVI